MSRRTASPRGFFLEQSIGRNVVVRTIDQLRGAFGLTDPGRSNGEVDEWVDSLRIKTSDPATAGQDAVRWQSATRRPRQMAGQQATLMILNGPTIGVDIGSKDELHDMMQGAWRARAWVCW